jgi:predicted ATPase/class 3 adenylate cyclase
MGSLFEGGEASPHMTARWPTPSVDARQPPTGTVTFLFTDIEGSTLRWETHRETMDRAVKRHDALLRSAIEANDGHVFKTVGDAFCAVFARVSDAVEACAHAQRALDAEDFSAVGGLRVRSALHTGEAFERSGDYFGPAVNRVARLLAIGHGGQVLVSGATREIAHGNLPSGASLVDLGSQRLKDLTEPEQVWQLIIAGLPSEFPALKSLETVPNNLPIQPTSFRGREHDLEELKQLLRENKLVTLVGSGGVGKTRLALQAGADLLDDYPDGVWLVDFAPLTDPELVSSVVARVLGMTQQDGLRIDESIPVWLKRKTLFLMLDNCEHVLGSVASIADSILRSCPGVRMLATSRQALDVGGEDVFRLPSLDVPDNIPILTATLAMESGAVVLFVDRARAVEKSFALTNDNAPIVADICRRLDGIPLAIELAAARVKVLSVPNLAQRLNDRFKILTGGSRSAIPRQKTLSALIDWSYDLLTAQEQLLFTRLGIFSSGFSLGAATAVCAGDGIDETDVLDLLASLADKSLVLADTSGDRERYRLLESTGAYALEKLASTRTGAAFGRRHAEFFRELALTADEHYGEGSRAAWTADIEREFDNYRGALEWALTRGNDAVIGGTIAGALGMFWANGGLAVEGHYWCELALARVSETEYPRAVARMSHAIAWSSVGKRKYDAALRALRLFESLGDSRWATRSRGSVAWHLMLMGRPDEARHEIEQALSAARACGDTWFVSFCLNVKATIEFELGNISVAREAYAQSLAIYKSLRNELGVAAVLGNLAELEFNQERSEEALRLASEASEIRQRGKNVADLASSRCNMAAYNIALGNFPAALVLAKDALHVARQGRQEVLMAIALQHLGLLSAIAGDERRAAHLLGYVDARFRTLDYERESTEKYGHGELIAALRKNFSDDEIGTLAAAGADWSEDQAVEVALRI